MRLLRKWTGPIAFLTLVAFWDATLRAASAHAQPAESAPLVPLSKVPPPSAPAVYDETTLQTLSEHLQSQAGAQAETPGQEPPPPEDVPKALAALPSGGGTVSPQATALPSGAATQLGMGESFTTQLSTGGAAYSIPLTLPSARGGVQPRLDLSYNSAGGFGTAGVGWSIGGTAITRQSDRGLPKFDDRAAWHPEQDHFVFGGMELVPICLVASNACAGAPGEVMPAWANGWQYFRARIEGGFLRFFWSPNHLTWRAQSKDGANMELGVPLDGTGDQGTLERNPDKPTQIQRWYLARQYDSQGGANNPAGPTPINVIVYRYLLDGGALYLSDIFDTPPAQSPSITDVTRFAHHTRLVYEARPDVATSYRSGWQIQYGLRILRADIASKPFSGADTQARQLARRYYFGYDAAAHRSLLSSVQIEGRCAQPVAEGQDQALPLSSCPRLTPMRFEYQHVASSSAALSDSQGLAFERFSETVQSLANSPAHSLDEALTELADINADGLPDVLVTAGGLYGGKHGLFLNGLDGTGARGFGDVSGMAVEPAGDVVDANVLAFDNTNVAALDLDADGVINLVHMPRAKSYSVFHPEETDIGSNEFVWRGRAVDTASQQDVKIDFTRDASNVRVMDVNGDGLADVVHSSPTELQTFFALGRYPGGDDQFGQATLTSATAASIGNDPVTACAPWSSTPLRFSDPDVQVADMNGDGLADLVRIRDGQLLYWPGRGNGFFGTGAIDDCPGGQFATDRHVEMWNPPRFGATQPGTLLLSDVNGDGLADLVEIRNQDTDIYLNDNGVGWTERHIIKDTPFLPAASNYARLTDINGSGTPDILWGHAHEYKYIDLTGGVTPHLLTKVHNGLGKTLELEYASSAELMLQAASAGKPWQTRSPTTLPVLVRSTARDHLELLPGRPAGAYVTQYSYRDPVFDGRQREFRGFREATVTSVGDGNGPTSSKRTTFLLGECNTGASIYGYAGTNLDVCGVSGRWRDNWREALKGLPQVSETFDTAGVALSTEHTTYTLRQLYTGLDGRLVVAAMPSAKDGYLYDTGAFDGQVTVTGANFLDDVLVWVLGLNGIRETSAVPMLAKVGTASVHSQATYDNYGNTLTSARSGCVAGCPNGVDEIITATSTFALPAGDNSGWLWREQTSSIAGNINTAARKQLTYTYDSRGQLLQKFATLSGTLALDRFHASGGTIAPAPPAQSGGTTGPVQLTLTTNTYDSFGHITFERGPNGRCSSGDVDAVFAHLPVTSRVYAGSLNTTTNCGNNALVHSVTYDRGLEVVLTSTSATNQPSRFDYDGFGRLTAITNTDPLHPGQLATLPSLIASYTLPADPTVTPYAITLVSTQDGADLDTNSYRQTWSYSDGFGRSIATLTPADPNAGSAGNCPGDGGNWVASGATIYDAKGENVVNYDPWFYSGAPDALMQAPYTQFLQGTVKAQQFDTFGRAIWTYDAGVPQGHSVHHALSIDSYDAEDLKPGGPHQGTYLTSVSDGHGRGVQRIDRVKVGASLEQRLTLNEYLPTGEVSRIVLRRAGSTDVVRWMRYDTLGRMVLNVEPNTSTGFNPDPNTPASSIKAWRYAYDDAGDTVGASDARGCGSNYIYDMGGRLLAEDRSPCLATQAVYTAPNLTNGDGTEVFYRYDTADPDGGTIVDAAGTSLTIDNSLLWGRLSSVSSLGKKGVFRYDALGRPTGGGLRVQKAGTPASALASRYAPRWYVTTQTLDAADRPLVATTGMTVPELRGDDGTSALSFTYTKRGVIKQIAGSYGTLLACTVHRADGLVQSYKVGDAAGTQRAFSYDLHKHMNSVQAYRGNLTLWSNPPQGSPYVPPVPTDDPTLQLLLEDYDVTYDDVGNITRIDDQRLPSEWPAQAKPVTRDFQYDDLYRLTSTTYTYAGGSTWQSPFAAENADTTRPQPNPHVSFSNRVASQAQQFDWLGNISQSTDDQQAFFDRSTGDRALGTPSLGPHRVNSASNRALAPSSTRKGDLSVGYDAAGNVTDLVVRRDGSCLPGTASCWQRFAYEWDEVGQLSRARRWDLLTTPTNERVNNDGLAEPLPARAANVELRYYYDSGGGRVLKTAIDALGNQLHTVYLTGSVELRRATWNGTDYTLDVTTAALRLPVGPVSARVLYAPQTDPSVSSGRRHVFLEFGDHLGSGSITIDLATSELVELATYEPYGAEESDYRPGRWASFREPYKFTGKEEDIEVGLQYFGARYYSPYIGTWLSTDPATIHDFKGDANPYAYVQGRVVVAVDPDGRFLIAAIAIGLLVGAIIGAVSSVAIQTATVGWSHIRWGLKGVLGAMIVGAVTTAVSGGVGSIISSAMEGVGSGFVSTAATSLTVGLVSGLAGGATSYLASAAVAKLDGQSVSLNWNDFGKSMGVGAAMGLAAGALQAGAAGLTALDTSQANVLGQSRSAYIKTTLATRTVGEAVIEATFTSAAQGAVAYGFLRVLGASKTVAFMGAGVGAFNGAVGGARGIYNWSNGTGILAAAADATTGLMGTALGDLSLMLNVPLGGSYEASLSFRQNRQVYSGGLGLKPGYDFTLGSVVSNDGGNLGLLNEHETMHIWQSRIFGPIYQATYVSWFAAGVIGATAYAPFAGANWGATVEDMGYRGNPFEASAYNNQGNGGSMWHLHNSNGDPLFRWLY